jgi:hypothetical protein
MKIFYTFLLIMLNLNFIVISAPIENVDKPRNPLSKNLIDSNSYYDYYSTTASPSAWDTLSDGARAGIIIAAIVGFLILVTLIIICTQQAYNSGNEQECNDILCLLSCCLYCTAVCLESAVENQNNGNNNNYHHNHRTCHHTHNCCCNKF